MELFTSYGKSNMHHMSMEAENRNSIKYNNSLHNKNDIQNKNIVVTSIR